MVYVLGVEIITPMATATSATAAFVDLLNERFNAEGYTYGIEPGRTNDRVWAAPIYNGEANLAQRSAYCFVRRADGAIFKTASWKTPAKGVRGYVLDVLCGNQRPGATTGWLYR